MLRFEVNVLLNWVLLNNGIYKQTGRGNKNILSMNKMPELEVNKLIFTGKIARVNGKTVINFLKTCKNDIREMKILKE